MPSELVNSVISKPQPPKPRITRRKSVSVTPAIGARIAAGSIVKSRILYSAGIITFSVVAGGSPSKTQCARRAKGAALLLLWRREREVLEKFVQAQEFPPQRTGIRGPLRLAGVYGQSSAHGREFGIKVVQIMKNQRFANHRELWRAKFVFPMMANQQVLH